MPDSGNVTSSFDKIPRRFTARRRILRSVSAESLLTHAITRRPRLSTARLIRDELFRLVIFPLRPLVVTFEPRPPSRAFHERPETPLPRFSRRFPQRVLSNSKAVQRNRALITFNNKFDGAFSLRRQHIVANVRIHSLRSE